MSAETKALVKELFEIADVKVTEDDPAVVMIAGIKTIMDRATKDFERSLVEFTHVYIDSIKNELDNANTSQMTNVAMHEQTLNDVFDAKVKDLVFYLNKVQATQEKDNTELFGRNIARIEELHNEQIAKIRALHAQQLKHQHQKDTNQQRDVLIGVGGMVIGIIISFLLFFIIK